MNAIRPPSAWAPAAVPAQLPSTLPVTAADLDAPWLAAALGLPTSGDHALTDVRIHRVGSDRGHLGSSYRADLDYRSPPAGAPRSVVVKLPAEGEGSLATAHRGRLYEREYRFFTELAPHTDVRAPGCFAAGYDEPTDTFALVLEDVSSTVEVDQLIGCPVELADLTLRELARLHASWWGRAQLYDHGWLTTFANADRLANLSRLMRQGWPALCSLAEQRLGPEARRIGEAVLEFLPHGLAALDELPQTLVHGDPRLDNLMFDAGAARAPIVLLDWQNVSRGAAVSDIAYFLAQSLTVPDLRDHGNDLLARYHAELVGHGATDYSLTALSAGLRRALPVSFAVAASLAVLADLTDPRVYELAVGMGERALAAADHMGLVHELRLA
jgi:hypothetical protein